MAWITRLESAPFPWADRPEQATNGLIYPASAYQNSEVLLHRSPAAKRREPAALVLWLHGQESTLARDVIGGPDIPGQIDAARAPLALVAPQLAFDVRDSCPGKLEEVGGMARLLEEAAIHLAQGGDPAPFLRAPVVIAAFSGGYRGAAACLARGGRRVSAVLLFDALYARLDDFTAWRLREPQGVLVALFGPSTAGNTEDLGRSLAGAGVPVGDSLSPPLQPGDARLVRVNTDHRSIPREGPPRLPLAALLRGLPKV